MAYPSGEPVHGEFASADASGLSEPNARLTLYGANSTSAITLNASDVVQIDSLSVSAGATLTVTIFDGADGSVGAGEQVFKGIVPANNTITPFMGVAHVCQKGTYPKVLASGAGQVRVQLQGAIIRLSN